MAKSGQMNIFLILLFCFIMGAHANYAQENEGVSPIEDSYYFSSEEFSEEYNFTNESIANILISVPQDYQHVEAGTQLLTTIKIVNLGSKRREDVVLDFEIVDDKKVSLLSKKETIAIETQVNLVRIFEIPESAKAGQYKIQAILIYSNGERALTEASFEIKPQNEEFYEIIYLIAGAIFAIVLIILISLKSGRWIDNYKIKRRVHHIVKIKLYTAKK